VDDEYNSSQHHVAMTYTVTFTKFEVLFVDYDMAELKRSAAEAAVVELVCGEDAESLSYIALNVGDGQPFWYTKLSDWEEGTYRLIATCEYVVEVLDCEVDGE